MSVDNETITGLTRDLARDLDHHFEDLVLAFQGGLYAYAFRMSGCAQDAEELVQDVFIRAYRALRTYEPDRIRSLALRAWLYRICLNLLRNRGKRKGMHSEVLDEERHERNDGDHDPTASAVARDETAGETQRLVATLPGKYRSAVLLRFAGELSYPEMAHALAQPEGTVKSNVHRGLAMLRQSMEEREGR
jgi:RNA polymerase sigma-70 factor (ECF subfamily)